jgi:hypothetical protein
LRVNPRQLIAASATLAVVVTATSLAQSGVGQRELRRIGLLSTAAGYTEVAFANPAKLPTTLQSSPRALHVAFTVTNRQRAAVSNGWQVVQTQPDRRILASGQVYVDQGQQAYVDPAIAVGCSQRTQITVALGSGQQIGFWVDCVRTATPTPRRESAGRPRRSSKAARKPRVRKPRVRKSPPDAGRAAVADP